MLHKIDCSPMPFIIDGDRVVPNPLYDIETAKVLEPLMAWGERMDDRAESEALREARVRVRAYQRKSKGGEPVNVSGYYQWRKSTPLRYTSQHFAWADQPGQSIYGDLGASFFNWMLRGRQGDPEDELKPAAFVYSRATWNNASDEQKQTFELETEAYRGIATGLWRLAYPQPHLAPVPSQDFPQTQHVALYEITSKVKDRNVKQAVRIMQNDREVQDWFRAQYVDKDSTDPANLPADPASALAVPLMGKQTFTKQAMYTPLYTAIDAFQRSWAQNTAGTTAQTIQYAAAREFGFDEDLFHGRIGTDLWEQVQEEYNGRNGPVYRGYVRAVYKLTQDRLKKLGIKEVILWRGTVAKDPPSDLALVKNDTIAGSTPDERGNIAPVVRGHSWLAPLSSWSASLPIAKGFSISPGVNLSKDELGHWGIMHGIRVPASRIWSTAVTGPGALNEWEYIVIGDERPFPLLKWVERRHPDSWDWSPQYVEALRLHDSAAMYIGFGAR